MDFRLHGFARRLGPARRRRLSDHVCPGRLVRARRVARSQAHHESLQTRNPAARSHVSLWRLGAEARARRSERKSHPDWRPQPLRSLYEYEEEFKKIFKVRVEFDEEMEMSDDVIRQYSGRLRKLCETEKLFPLDRTAVAGIIEYGVRLAGRRNKVTARFPDLADLAREACYAARQAGDSTVTAASRAARQARIERHNLMETKIQEMISEGTLLIDTQGARPGQINGLSRPRNRRLRLWQACAHHRLRRAGQDRPHQHRARSQSQRTSARQGHADHRRLSAGPVRAG